MKKRAIFVLIIPVLLCSCDGSMTIRGETPKSTSCVLTLTDQATGHVANTFTVSGRFSQGVFFPGTWHAPPMTLDAECGGKIVRTISNPSFGDVKLGQLEH